METFFALTGVLGALCCVGVYASVSLGYASADRPMFFIGNGIGAMLVAIGASHQFDTGDLGTIVQELVWVGISVAGALRAVSRRKAIAMPRTTGLAAADQKVEEPGDADEMEYRQAS